MPQSKPIKAQDSHARMQAEAHVPAGVRTGTCMHRHIHGRVGVHTRVTRARGFSLLEVLLALMLLAMLMAGAYSAISATTKSAQRGEALIDRTNRVRTAQELLRRQIGQALSLPYTSEKTTGEQIVFEGDSQSIQFVGPMPGYMGSGGSYVQTISFVRKNGDTKLVFEHELLNGYEDEKKRRKKIEPVVLFEHIERGQFEFRRLDDTGKLANWRDDWDRKGAVPLLIRIAVTPKRDSQLQWPELVVPVRVDPGAALQGSGYNPYANKF